MSSKGIMRRAPQFALALAFIVPSAFAQTPPVDNPDDLDVTMRVIVDPKAKVPDEIVRKIPLPRPAPAQKSGKPDDTGKPADPGAQGQQRASDARELGREFGQEVAEQAKQRSEEARRNAGPPSGTPQGPPVTPPAPPTPRPPR
jgi:hypothetical protein